MTQPIRSQTFSIMALLVLSSTLALVPACNSAQAVPIPDLEVAGPHAGFDMGSRLMTSASRTEVTLSVPGKGKVKVPKFNGTFFYRHSNPEATSGTLLFRPDQFEDIEGSLSGELVQALDFDSHPFFAFQSRSASASHDGIDLHGTLIVKGHETEATMRFVAPGPVAVDAEGSKWVEIPASMEVSSAPLGLEALGDSLRFDFAMHLRGYTVKSAEKTGVDTAGLNKTPPNLSGDAEELSNAAWYLMLNGRYAEAIEGFDKSIEKNPRSVNTYLRRGDAYLFNGDYGKAMGTYKAMTEYMPVHPHIFELTKVLDNDYLTPDTLHAANQKWIASR